MSPSIVLVLLSLATPLTCARSRSPVVRVAVEGAQTGLATALTEALGRQKPGSILGCAVTGEPADLALYDAGYYGYVVRGGGSGGSFPAPLKGEPDVLDENFYRSQAATPSGEGYRMHAYRVWVHDARVAGLPVRRPSDLLEGSGDSLPFAVGDLMDHLAKYARLRQHELLRNRPDWPDVGFAFEPLNEQLKKQFRAKGGEIVVTTVTPGGVAERAGLRPGDAIRGLADKKLKSPAELARLLYVATPGTRVSLQVSRGGARRNIILTTPSSFDPARSLVVTGGLR